MARLINRLFSIVLGSDAESFTVKDFSLNQLSGKGDNFMSQLFIVDIAASQNGEEVNRSVIVKIVPEGEWQKNFVAEMSLFEKEIDMYTKVVPAMMKYQTQKGPKIMPPLPKCFYGKFDGTHGVLVLENLRDKGYEMGDVKIGLDYEESLAVMKAYAVFHALGYNLQKQVGTEMEKEFPAIFKMDMSSIKEFLNHVIETAEKIVSKEPNQEKIIEKLKMNNKNVFELMDDAAKPLSMPTICHGDPWMNNLMIVKTKPEVGEKEISAILLDLQLNYFGTGACDLGEIIASSCQAKVQKDNIQEILATYHKTFNETLDALNVPADYSYDAFQKEYKQCFYHGFIKGLSMVQMFGLMGKEELAQMMEEFKGIEDMEAAREEWESRTDAFTIQCDELKERFLQILSDSIDYDIFPN